MRVRDEHPLDEVVLLRRGRLLAAPAAALRPVLVDRLRLHVAAVRHRDDHVLRRDQVLDRQVLALRDDLGASLVAELVADRLELAADDPGHALGLREDVDQVGDQVHHLAVLAGDLVLLETGQALQAHLEDRLRLRVREPVALGRRAEVRREPLGPRLVGDRALQHLVDDRAAPGPTHQRDLRLGRGRRRLDQRDHLVDVGERDGEALEDVPPLARLAQVEARAPDDDLAPVLQEELDELLEVQEPRLVVDQRDHVHAEAVLQLRQLVQVVEDDLRDLAALQLDHDAHAGLVRLVAQVRDPLELLLADELADAAEQVRLVHLVGDLVDDDRLPVALVEVLDVRARADDDAAAAGPVALAHPLEPVDDPGGREVRRRDDLHQLVDRDPGIREHREAAVDRLAEVVRRDVGRHPHRDARAAVHEQVGQPGRQDRGLELLAVVVRDEVDRLLVDVRGELVGDLLQPALGVAHRGRVVAVDRPEVALPVDERVAQAEVLRHPHERVVDRHVAVRVVFPHHVADHARALHVRPVPDDVRLGHRVEHPAVHRLQPVADVGQRPSHDHAHRVIEVAVPHLGFQADGEGFLGEGVHARCVFLSFRVRGRGAGAGEIRRSTVPRGAPPSS